MLIAFAIAAICLAVVIDGSISALSAAGIARDTQNAVVRARSRLAALDGGGLVPGTSDGDDGGGYRWRTQVTELASGVDSRTEAAHPGRSQASRETLYAVEVSVSWTRGGHPRSVQLDSTRLAQGAP